MGDLADTGEGLARKWMFSTASVTRPTQWFMALYSLSPSDAGGGTEIAAAGYARQAITFDSNGATNTLDVVFGPAAADWGTITHGAIFDESNRFLGYHALATPITVALNDSVTFAAGAITVEFD